MQHKSNVDPGQREADLLGLETSATSASSSKTFALQQYRDHLLQGSWRVRLSYNIYILAVMHCVDGVSKGTVYLIEFRKPFHSAIRSKELNLKLCGHYVKEIFVKRNASLNVQQNCVAISCLLQCFNLSCHKAAD